MASVCLRLLRKRTLLLGLVFAAFTIVLILQIVRPFLPVIPLSNVTIWGFQISNNLTDWVTLFIDAALLVVFYRSLRAQQREIASGDERFFIDKRNTHYRILNEQSFKLIQQLQLEINAAGSQNTWGRLKVHFRFPMHYNMDQGPILLMILMAAPAFKDAEKHLQVDAPNVLSALIDLSNSVQKLNEDTDRFQTELRERAIETCSKIAPLTLGMSRPEPYINMQGVMRVLEAYLMPFFERYFAGEPLDMILADMPRFEQYFNPTKRGIVQGELIIHDQGVSRGLNEQQESELIQVLRELQHDEECRKRLIDFADRKKTFPSKLLATKEGLGDIIYRIDSGKYDTVVSGCCP